MSELDVSMPTDRWEMVTLPDQEAAVTFAVAHFIETGRKAIEARGLFSVALSGGSTPKAIYAMLTEPEIAPLLDWSRVLLFFSDERAVPPDHEESNFHMAMSRLSKLPIREENVFRMQAEHDIEVQAAAYEHLLKKKCEGVLDLIMLGMGPDGHTASLFPETGALSVTDRLVVPNYIPKLDAWRLTLTFPCINAARNTVLYVLGEEKRDILNQVMQDDGRFPVQKVDEALWITDVHTNPGI
jgi:6-phosphogluconolactonase